jgi:predicted transcriptional regulator
MNRSRDGIIADLLSRAKEPVGKTALMYGACISFTQLNVYLNYLIERQLIESEGGTWVITDNGKIFLSNYQLVAESIA